MRTRAVSRFLAPLAIALALSLGACATATPPGATTLPAGAPAALNSAAPNAAAGSGTGTATPAGIPSAPGPVGSAGPSPSTSSPPSLPSPAPVTTAAGVVATPLPTCRSGSLATVVSGKLTFTTGQPRAPWFVGDDPADGRGYESAVAAAVAEQLGYRAGDVTWTRSDLSAVAAGRGTGFDVAVGEFPTPAGVGPVDYSTGYFSISDSVVARTGTPAAGVSTLTGLKSLRLGAVSGTTGTRSLLARVTEATAPTAFATPTAALAALKAGAVQAVVLPTPVAVGAGAGVAVLGQLNDPTEQPQQFGMVLPKKSPLTSCVSAAIDELRITGRLSTLLKTWVPAADKPLR